MTGSTSKVHKTKNLIQNGINRKTTTASLKTILASSENCAYDSMHTTATFACIDIIGIRSIRIDDVLL